MSQDDTNPDSEAEEDVQAPPPEDTQDTRTTQPRGQAQTTGGQVGQPVETGPSVADMLQRPAIQDELKYLVATYALLGVGFGFLGIVIGEVIGGGGIGGAFFDETTLVVVLSVGPVLALVFGYRLSDVLSDAEDTALYAAAAVGNAAGYFVMVLIAGILLSSGSGGGTNLGDLLLSGIVLGIVVGAIGAGLALVQRSLG